MTPLLAISTINVKAPVSASQLPGTITDPTPYPVYMAFGTKPAAPAAPGGGGGWHVASWQTVNQTYYAVCLEGPLLGAVNLGPGTWPIFVQVGDTTTPANGEIPVLPAGALTLT